jgi:hypothetical protein
MCVGLASPVNWPRRQLRDESVKEARKPLCVPMYLLCGLTPTMQVHTGKALFLQLGGGEVTTLPVFSRLRPRPR